MKKIILNLSLILSLLPLGQVWASNAKLDKEVAELEKYVLDELNKKNVSQETIFFHYLLAGRETYTLGLDQYSKKYFAKALEMKVQEDKTEAYVNLIAIAHREKKEADKKKYIADFELFLKANSRFATPVMTNYLEFLKTGKPGTMFQHYFGFYSSMNSLEDSIKKKNYLQAYMSINPKGLEGAEIGLKTTYDLLNVLVNKKKAKKLLCMDTYKKFPKAFSYSVKICAILEQYLAEGKVQPTRIDDLKKYFEKNHQDRAYLVSAVEDLK